MPSTCSLTTSPVAASVPDAPLEVIGSRMGCAHAGMETQNAARAARSSLRILSLFLALLGRSRSRSLLSGNELRDLLLHRGDLAVFLGRGAVARVQFGAGVGHGSD